MRAENRERDKKETPFSLNHCFPQIEPLEVEGYMDFIDRKEIYVNHLVEINKFIAFGDAVSRDGIPHDCCS